MTALATRDAWTEQALALMRQSYLKAISDGFNPERWVSGKRGVAQFKARPTRPEFHRWMEFHAAEGRPGMAEVARRNLSRDAFGTYWPVPAQWPPARSARAGARHG